MKKQFDCVYSCVGTDSVDSTIFIFDRGELLNYLGNVWKLIKEDVVGVEKFRHGMVMEIARYTVPNLYFDAPNCTELNILDRLVDTDHLEEWGKEDNENYLMATDASELAEILRSYGRVYSSDWFASSAPSPLPINNFRVYKEGISLGYYGDTSYAIDGQIWSWKELGIEL